jgi:hypothetical protein
MAKKVTVTNLNKVYRGLKTKGEAFARDVKAELLIRATQIELSANQYKPDGITIKRIPEDNGFTQLVSAAHNTNPKLAAYMEFGTGDFAAYFLGTNPQYIKDLARQYYVNGQGRLPSMPYITPAYIRERKKFLENVKKIVKRYSA